MCFSLWQLQDCDSSCFFCLPSGGWGWGFCKLPDGRDWRWEKLRLVLVGKAMLSKTLIRLSADGWGYAPFLLVFGLRWHSPGVQRLHRRNIGDLQDHLCQVTSPRTAATSAPFPMADHYQPMPLQETLTQIDLAQSSVRPVFLSPGSLCAQGFVCAPWE